MTLTFDCIRYEEEVGTNKNNKKKCDALEWRTDALHIMRNL
jgi:hypothetical protein